ncbi:MAG TPA: hypothetical protein VKX49_24055 [Bryobacteraceae bacterium]|nr:hypothetical protein [Bryobacteraceae bacterium]
MAIRHIHVDERAVQPFELPNERAKIGETFPADVLADAQHISTAPWGNYRGEDQSSRNGARLATA